MKRLTTLLLFWAAVAHADAEKRAVPDYDGRGDAPLTAGEVALWVPRAAAAPFYFVSEYMIRRPAGWLVVNGERHRVPQRIVDFFTTDDRKLGVIPTFYAERGYHPVAGIYIFADDLGLAGNHLRVSGSLGFGHRALTVSDRLVRGPWALTLRAHESQRDDHVYYGEGPSSSEADRARFDQRRRQASGAIEARAGMVQARAEIGWRDVALRSSTYGGDPSVMDDDLADYRGLFERLDLVFDTRTREDGFRFALGLEHGPRWDRATGSVAASAGLGRGRVATLAVTATIVEDGQDGEVPLTELATVGGSGPLPGFGAERLVGRSALAVSAQYEWPIWMWLNGALYAGAGDVFGERFESFDMDLMRLSGGMGVRTAGSSDNRFEILVAAGTEPLRDGAGIEAVRIYAGSTHAF